MFASERTREMAAILESSDDEEGPVAMIFTPVVFKSKGGAAAKPRLRC